MISCVESLNTAQRTVALDTKYNTFRPLPNQHRKTIYIPPTHTPPPPTHTHHTQTSHTAPSHTHTPHTLPPPTRTHSGMLYLRRRNQLLQENAKYSDDVAIRQFYLQQRSLVLASKYGPLDRRCVSVVYRVAIEWSQSIA